MQFEKATEVPLETTLMLNTEQARMVARILHGAMTHRQGSLPVGDEILESSGTHMTSHSADQCRRQSEKQRNDLSKSNS